MSVIQNIINSVGHIYGRDAIHVDKIEYHPNKYLLMEGEINATLCSIEQSAKWLKYKMSFDNIVYQTLYEHERFGYIFPSSTDNIIEKKESDVIPHLNNSSNYKHYAIETYDFILEVVCKNFNFEIINQR